MLSKHENHRLPILTPPLLEHHSQSQVYQFLFYCALCFFRLFLLLLTGMHCPSLWPRKYFPLGLSPSDIVHVRLFPALFSQSYQFLHFCSLNLPLPCYHTAYIALQSFFLKVDKFRVLKIYLNAQCLMNGRPLVMLFELIRDMILCHKRVFDI